MLLGGFGMTLFGNLGITLGTNTDTYVEHVLLFRV